MKSDERWPCAAPRMPTRTMHATERATRMARTTLIQALLKPFLSPVIRVRDLGLGLGPGSRTAVLVSCYSEVDDPKGANKTCVCNGDHNDLEREIVYESAGVSDCWDSSGSNK